MGRLCVPPLGADHVMLMPASALNVLGPPPAVRLFQLLIGTTPAKSHTGTWALPPPGSTKQKPTGASREAKVVVRWISPHAYPSETMCRAMPSGGFALGPMLVIAVRTCLRWSTQLSGQASYG